MSFSCSVSLSNIDSICQKSSGGLKKLILCDRDDVSISFLNSVTKEVSSITALNPSYIEFLINDGFTSFNENSSNSGGLSIFETSIVVDIQSISSNLNKIDDMSLKPDIVAICQHTNNSISVTGYDFADIVSMNYDSDSGSAISDRSYIRVNLLYSTKYGSIYMDDTSLFTNPNIFN